MSPGGAMSPRAFGKYEVLARLATGGAASIFLARQPGVAGFAKLVCLKTLLPERASDDDFLAMFLDEARLAARLNHPNCVQIYDLGKVRGVYYISMEYIFGETLWNLLATVTRLRTPLPALQVAHIIGSVCDGLHHAHELKDSEGCPYNLVHRDVSPQNVMVTYEGQTKVVDFGIAKAATGRVPTDAGIVKGKFSYMSPEQITGSSVDRRSDIYSLGILMFECLASRRLYRGSSPEDIARLIVKHRAPRLRDVVPETPAALDEVCARALAWHREERYQTAQEMGEAIRGYLAQARYNQSSAELAQLMAERFGSAIAERRKVYEVALNEANVESELLDVLGAQPVRYVDLFSDPEDEEEVDLRDAQDADDVRSLAGVPQRMGHLPGHARSGDLVVPQVRVTPFESTSMPPDPAEHGHFQVRLSSNPPSGEGAEETKHAPSGRASRAIDSDSSNGEAAPRAESRPNSLVREELDDGGRKPRYLSAIEEPSGRMALPDFNQTKPMRGVSYELAQVASSTILDEASSVSRSPSHMSAPAKATQSTLESPPESSGAFQRLRFSFAVVVAALIFGISLGMVLGVLVARWVVMR